MSQSQDAQRNGNKTTKPELDPETIKAIVAQQGDKLKIEAQKIRLEEKRLDQNGVLAEKSLQLNSEIIKRHPSEQRKTIAVIGSIVIAIIVIFLVFILFCLSQGNTEFADKFLNWIGHIGGALGGYFVGKWSGKKKQSNEDPIPSEPEDAEIVD